jgi:hypothetical protein
MKKVLGNKSTVIIRCNLSYYLVLTIILTVIRSSWLSRMLPLINKHSLESVRFNISSLAATTAAHLYMIFYSSLLSVVSRVKVKWGIGSIRTTTTYLVMGISSSHRATHRR